MNLWHIRTGCLLLLLLALVGCGRSDSNSSKPDQATSEKDLRVQPGTAGKESETWGYLALQIAHVHEKQQPLDQFPWHKDGGDWTFLDCRPAKDPMTRIVIGVRTKSAAKSNSPFGGWGEALLAADANAGAAFVETFTRAFHQPSPARHGRTPTGRVKAETAVLGVNMARSPEGGFGGKRKGTWTATKWFLSDDISETEVFFNFSLVDKRAEFSEKDEEYREGLVRQLVVGLRDGPLPERTPENDSTLTLVGPQVTNWSRIADRKASCRFTADSAALIFSETSDSLSTKMFSAPVTNPADRKKLAEFEGVAYISQVFGASSDSPILIQETLRKNPGEISTGDPARLWLVSPGLKQPIDVPPSITNWSLAAHPVSPDKQFIVLQTWARMPNKKGARIIHIGDRKSAQWHTVSLPGLDLDFEGWLGKGGQGIALASTNALQSDQAKPFRLDPATGQLTELVAIPPGFGPHERLSPDGKLIAKIEKKESLLLTGVANHQTR